MKGDAGVTLVSNSTLLRYVNVLRGSSPMPTHSQTMSRKRQWPVPLAHRSSTELAFMYERHSGDLRPGVGARPLGVTVRGLLHDERGPLLGWIHNPIGHLTPLIQVGTRSNRIDNRWRRSPPRESGGLPSH